MKIVLIGQASASGELGSYQRAFTALGHTVLVLDSTALFRITFPNRVLNWALYKFDLTPVYFGLGRYNRDTLAMIKEERPDLALFFDVKFTYPGVIRAMKAAGSRVFSKNDDAIFHKRNLSQYFFRSAKLCDHVFSMNSRNVRALVEKGIRASFLPFAVDKTQRYPVVPNDADRQRLGADIVFVGTYADEERVSFLNRLCSEGYDVKIYGNSWERCRECGCLDKKKAIQYRPVVGEEMSAVFNASKITLAFLRQHNHDAQTSRTYEIPACGGFMLHERTAEATELFGEDQEAAFFGSYQEMKEKIDYYLAHPEERTRIAANGLKRAGQPEYSYEDRAAKVLDIYRSITTKIHE